MNSITSISRSQLWSIKIHTDTSIKLEPSRNDIKAGFVCCGGLFIYTSTIFEDLKIIYPTLHNLPDGSSLTLWQEHSDGSVEFTSASEGDKEFKMTTSGSELYLGLIVHNADHPLCKTSPSSAGINEHIDVGCAVIPNLKFNPKENVYLPAIPNYHTPSLCFSTPSTPFNKKRKLAEDSASNSSTLDSLELRRKQDQDSRELAKSLGVDMGSFDEAVKITYDKCVITRTSSKWGSLICGPGYIASHIMPQKLWFSYPDWHPSPVFEKFPFNVIPSYNTDEDTLRKRMQSTWGPANSLLLRADIHDMFDQRMIAIHPVTSRIRLFAPMPVAMEYHGQVVEWEVIPDRAALAHHYTQFVIENVAANMTSGSEYVVPEMWRPAIDLVSSSVLDSRSLQDLEERGGDTLAQEVDYFPEDGLTEKQEDVIESWLERE
ncbi:hypothetical protein TWF102_009722 [Orbilia oligospora]|uniref:HNH nuclease domain-containing protein n=1 Tax=Orbilia oligospora TaxID=2813651 RepID=A0A7C8NJH2_ORBOL|nr:hypothetical protein TWF102_009722 [Orbilia oligospora]KAF3148605.1 hypothetical protein TWF594_001016 [Orbilia oligospora]